MPFPDEEIFGEALERGQFGLAIFDERLIVANRLGSLCDWLPPAGKPACDAPLLMHMEGNLENLRERGGEMVLPSVRAWAGAPRVTVSISWNARARVFVAVTAPDHAGEQIDRLMASDRRERQILRQQADAAAARLRVADALYRDIVEASADLVLRFRPDCKIVFVNRAAAAFFGRPQDALIGEALDRLFPAPDNSPCRLGAAADGAASFEMAARDARGRAVWLAWEVRFLDDEAGGEFQAVARDVTAERRLRVERERAQEEARAAAVANERLRIAHELHDTLVRSIVTMIAEARLIAKTTGDPQTRAALAALDAQARQGLWEARDAIAQTRAARREEKDLRAIAAEFAQRWGELAVTLDMTGFDVLPDATERLFGAVLREALRNVELHSGARRVRVTLRTGEGGAELVVEDDGCGFDPQAPAPGHFGVTGMRERAQLAGAGFEIDSAPGGGTRVRVTAPAANGADQAKSAGS